MNPKNQRVTGYSVEEATREVVTRTTVSVETRTPTNRWHYQGMSEDQIIEYEKNQERDALLEDFVDEIESTPHEKLIIIRTVTIEDKK